MKNSEVDSEFRRPPASDDNAAHKLHIYYRLSPYPPECRLILLN